MQRPDLIIFEQGEKAKAAEVNQNFEELGDYIQGSISEVNTTVTNAISSLQTLVNSAAPTGVVQAYAGSSAPSGWLLCEGQAVSRTQYSGLFAVIGTTFGGGDGTTTFNVPNLINKFIEGSDTVGTEKEAGVPNITGAVPNFWCGGPTSANGAFALAGSGSSYGGGTSSGKGFNFDASRSSAIYGNSNTVQPPAVTMKYIIKA